MRDLLTIVGCASETHARVTSRNNVTGHCERRLVLGGLTRPVSNQLLQPKCPLVRFPADDPAEAHTPSPFGSMKCVCACVCVRGGESDPARLELSNGLSLVTFQQEPVGLDGMSDKAGVEPNGPTRATKLQLSQSVHVHTKQPATQNASKIIHQLEAEHFLQNDRKEQLHSVQKMHTVHFSTNQMFLYKPHTFLHCSTRLFSAPRVLFVAC